MNAYYKHIYFICASIQSRCATFATNKPFPTLEADHIIDTSAVFLDSGSYACCCTVPASKQTSPQKLYNSPLKSNCNNKQLLLLLLLFVAVADNIPVALMGWTGFVGIWNFPLKSCCSSCEESVCNATKLSSDSYGTYHSRRKKIMSQVPPSACYLPLQQQQLPQIFWKR